MIGRLLYNCGMRHHIMAEAFRAAMEALNIKLVADRECAADTLTAPYHPEYIEDLAFGNGMRQC